MAYHTKPPDHIVRVISREPTFTPPARSATFPISQTTYVTNNATSAAYMRSTKSHINGTPALHTSESSAPPSVQTPTTFEQLSRYGLSEHGLKLTRVGSYELIEFLKPTKDQMRNNIQPFLEEQEAVWSASSSLIISRPVSPSPAGSCPMTPVLGAMLGIGEIHKIIASLPPSPDWTRTFLKLTNIDVSQSCPNVMYMHAADLPPLDRSLASKSTPELRLIGQRFYHGEYARFAAGNICLPQAKVI